MNGVGSEHLHVAMDDRIQWRGHHRDKPLFRHNHGTRAEPTAPLITRSNPDVLS